MTHYSVTSREKPPIGLLAGVSCYERGKDPFVDTRHHLEPFVAPPLRHPDSDVTDGWLALDYRGNFVGFLRDGVVIQIQDPPGNPEVVMLSRPPSVPPATTKPAPPPLPPKFSARDVRDVAYYWTWHGAPHRLTGWEEWILPGLRVTHPEFVRRLEKIEHHRKKLNELAEEMEKYGLAEDSDE